MAQKTMSSSLYNLELIFFPFTFDFACFETAVSLRIPAIVVSAAETDRQCLQENTWLPSQPLRCDSNMALLVTGELRALEPIFKIYGQRRAFSGPIVTLKVFEENVLVKQFFDTRGEGRVLVIDGAGSTRRALLGGNLAKLAQNNGWAGVVVNGCIRDVDEVNACDIGVWALGSSPLKPFKKPVGEKHIPISIAGTLIRDGEWLYADSDGILVSKIELSI